jgi:hypothetical protein
MINPIQTIIEKLKKYPEATYSSTDDSITVEPKDEKGFAVSIDVGPREIMVHAGFWHEHFDIDNTAEALDCFAFLLSDSCRLRVDYRGDKPKRWTIESFQNGSWIGDSETGVLNFNFWSPKRTEYFENNLIKTRGENTANGTSETK